VDLAGASVLPLAPDSSVVLDNGSSGRAFIRADGTFVIHDVASGSYVLSVQDRTFAFPSYKVDIAADDAANPIQVRPFTLGRLSADPSTVPLLPYPLVIKPTSRLEYYEKREGFSLWGMIQQNKMILFMVGGIVFAMGMPKLLAMIDPEALKEAQASQADLHRSMQAMQSVDVAGGLSKMLSGGDTSQAAASSARSSGDGFTRRRKA